MGLPSAKAVIRLWRALKRSSWACPTALLLNGTPLKVEAMSVVSLRERKIVSAAPKPPSVRVTPL